MTRRISNMNWLKKTNCMTTAGLIKKLPFFSDCVSWPHRYMDALNFLIDNGQEISRDEFIRSTQSESYIEYIPKWDNYIRYKKLESDDGDAYWFIHSSIEYVFAFPKTIKSIQNLAQYFAIDGSGILNSLRPKFAEAAQEIYDQWDQSDELYGDTEVAFGGICHLIAEKISDIIFDNTDLESTTISAQIEEQHVWSIAKADGVYEIDIPPGIYEIGSGYNWKKIPGVKFDQNDIIIRKISANPQDFDQYTEYVG